MPRAKIPSTAKSSRKQVLAMPEAGSVSPQRPNGLSAPLDLENQIRQRAYELFEERGRAPGQENEDWFRAEREVLARCNHQHTA